MFSTSKQVSGGEKTFHTLNTFKIVFFLPLRTDYTQRYSPRREPLRVYFACEAKEKKTNIQCNKKLKAVILYF